MKRKFDINESANYDISSFNNFESGTIKVEVRYYIQDEQQKWKRKACVAVLSVKPEADLITGRIESEYLYPGNSKVNITAGMEIEFSSRNIFKVIS